MMIRTRLRRIFGGLVAASLLWIGTPARATIITPLGTNSGWQAEFADSLNSFVQIVTDDQTATTLTIEKTAQFTQLDRNGQVVPIDIVFRQTGPSTITNIVIGDEVVTNQSGVEWTDFHFEISPGGGAAFDPVATNNSGGPPPIGFSIAPFTTAVFGNGNRTLDIGGGVLANNATWFPGTSGSLFIAVTSQPEPPFSVFTLREAPSIPEPAMLGTFSIIALTLLRRRQS